MVSTTLLGLAVACAGSALTMLAADTSPWVVAHHWLLAVLCYTAIALLVGAIVASHWFRSNMPNLTYLIPFDSLGAREKAWDTFQANPD
jgi:hypothetical protein